MGRPVDGVGEVVKAPSWLRIEKNNVKDPEGVLRTAEREGITICNASDRQACGPSKCCRGECPLAHLYAFLSQGIDCGTQDRSHRTPKDTRSGRASAATAGWSQWPGW